MKEFDRYEPTMR